VPAAKRDSRHELVTILVTIGAEESRNRLIRLWLLILRCFREPNVLSPIRTFKMLQIEENGSIWRSLLKRENLG
jgi:hypothetical protein